MKKVISLLLALLLCLGLCACGGASEEAAPADDAAAEVTEEESTGAEMPAPAEEAAEEEPAAEAGEGVSLDLMFVNNINTNALVEIAQEYYKPEGVTLNIQVLPEDDMREKFTTEASTGGDTYDLYYIGPYETAIWASYGWIEDLTPFIDGMTDEEKAAWDMEDIFALQMDALKYDGKQYAIPFYGEASFLMFNKELFDQAGVAYPDNPKFADLLDIAASLDGQIGDAVPWVCRGQPGWGNSGASIFTALRAFGSSFYDMDWNVTFDSEETRAGLQWYHDMVVEYGPADPTSYSYNESAGLYQQGKVAMWYDATPNGLHCESSDSMAAGKTGYTTIQEAHWVWNWAFAINPYSDVKEEV